MATSDDNPTPTRRWHVRVDDDFIHAGTDDEARVEFIQALAEDGSLIRTAQSLAAEVLSAMEQDCGPIYAEPYSSWAKTLALYVIELAEVVAALAASEPDGNEPGWQEWNDNKNVALAFARNSLVVA